MKTLILVIAILTSSADAAVFGYRQSASQSGNTALAFSSNNVAGNMIVVATSKFSVSAVTDTQSNSYNLVSAQVNGNPQLQVWVALNIKAGANSVTATGLNPSGANSSIAIIEYTVPASFAFGASNGGPGTPNNGSNTLHQSPSETLLVIASFDFATSHTWTGTNLTIRETVQEGGGQTLAIGDFDALTSTTATISTLGGCTGQCLSAALLNFQTTGGGAGTPAASAFVGLQ